MNGDGEPIISPESVKLDSQSHDPPQSSFNVTNTANSLLAYPSPSTPPPEIQSAGSPPPDDAVDNDLRTSKPSSPTLESGAGESSEAPSDTFVPSSDPVLTTEETQEWFPEGDHDLKRVKVYELVGSRWADQGTAFCFGQFQEETGEALLVARSEANYQDIILSTAIRSNDVYQLQQDTLIVWTEPDGVDYALSFQDPEGCSEVWNFIVEVKKHMNGVDQANTSSSPTIIPEQASVTTATIMRSGHLPPPQLGIISDIDKAIKALARTQAVKERICEYIQQEDYIKSLIDVMSQAEDLESVENLHALCSLIQTILMLNDHAMYEHILDDDIFLGVVGMLEYDPEFPTHKANYRDFLRQSSRFHQPIPINDDATRKKIHHTYRLQFLKDVVLARVLDDSTFNVLNSCIIFNQIDIIQHVQHDPQFLRDIMQLYVDDDMLHGGGPREAGEVESNGMDVDHDGNGGSKAGVHVNGLSSRQNSTPPEDGTEEGINRRREVVFLIQQLCVMGKNVQLPARMALFRTLVDRGILFAVQWALSFSEKDEISKQLISAGGEILACLLDHDIHGVRGHVLRQVGAIEKEKKAGKEGADQAETVLALMCRMLASSQDLAVQCQVGDALKTLLDIPPNDNETQTVVGVKLLARMKDEPGIEKFLDYFYKHCIETLFRPFQEVPEFKNLTNPLLHLTRETTNRYLYLCDLLGNFALQHSFRSHFYMLSSNISLRVASLLRARDKHLKHVAFRFFRICLKLNNRNFLNHLMKHDVLKPLLELTLQESRRDNLLSSSCQEFFEHMRKENMKELIKHCMTKHDVIIQQLASSLLGGPRFSQFIRRWEMNNEPLPPADDKSNRTADVRFVPGHSRHLEAEEEDYFNADDDEDDVVQPISSQWRVQSSIPAPNLLKRKRRPAVGSLSKNFRPPSPVPPRTPPLGSLVDYEDEDDSPSGPAEEPVSAIRSSSPSPPAQHQIVLKPSPSISKVLTRPLTPNKSIAPPKHPSSTCNNSKPTITTTTVVLDADDPDDFITILSASKQPPSPASSPSLPTDISGTKSFFGHMRSSEKRRREEDDDGLLERLNKSKKFQLGSAVQKDSSGLAARTGASVASAAAATKAGDGNPPPKKFKLKLGLTSLGAPSPAPPAENESQNRDTG